MAKVLVVGLNPAWQTILEFPSLCMGQVNRARSKTNIAAGKGFNAAKVLARLGHEVWLLQILGGSRGRLCLQGCEAHGIRSVAAWAEEETRQCYTLLDITAHTATEIIEPFSVSKPNLDTELLELLPMDPLAFEALVFCGSIPAGVSPRIFTDVRSRFAARIAVLDAWQGIDAHFLAQVTCAKMNAEEFSDLQKKLSVPLGQGPSPLFAITAGPGEARMLRGLEILGRFKPPVLEGAINPIGAGDTVTAGLVHHLLQGLAAPESFRRALAMGSASCLNRFPAEYSEAEYLRLIPEVVSLNV